MHDRDGAFIDRTLSLMDITAGGVTGGLVGFVDANGLDLEIFHSHFGGSINAFESSPVGGLLGAYTSNGHSPSVYINQSFVEADIVNSPRDVGGLIGVTGANVRPIIDNSYYIGDIETSGAIAGGLIGSAAEQAEINRSYAAGSISSTAGVSENDDVPWTGGLVGYLPKGGWIALSFANMDIVHENDEYDIFASGMIGRTDPDDTYFMGSYYNSDVGQGYCANGEIDFVVYDDCIAKSFTDEPDYFIANSDNMPMQGWDFEDIWHIREANYPSLAPIEEPQVLCEQSTTTETSLHVACGLYSSDGMLYGPTTWELRYKSLDSADSWQSVNVPPYSYFDEVITGLQPNTNYRAEFRYTDDRGESQWYHIDATTDAGTPSTPKPGPGIIIVPTGSATVPSARRIATATVDLPVPTETKISLNDFVEFTNGQGKQLDLKIGQVIYFTVKGIEHSATVKEVGADYVIVTLASTPQDVRLGLGQTGQYDVDGDGKPDIEISLRTIVNGVAGVTFKEVTERISQPISSNDTAVGRATNWLFWLLIGGGITFMLLIVVIGRHWSNKDDRPSHTF